ncbi:MAG: winged helix-turn-helix transcriptional regulator [Acidobacteria bacterium]|nr:winged helix-turn-helix transcriptional regulator [Acidobacteriota bacterium]
MGGIAPGQSTKTEILRLLKVNGDAQAKAIAEACGLTTMAVRRHLLDLRAAGLIEVKTERRPKGRPTAVHSLSELGHAGFPRDYEGLAFDVLSSLRALDGEAKVRQVFRRRRRELTARYLPRMKGKGLEQRVREVAAILTEDGYMADVSPAGRDSFVLTERNCALPRVAECFPATCEEELSLIRDLAGASVKRVCHALAGDRHCSYLIRREGTRGT